MTVELFNISPISEDYNGDLKMEVRDMLFEFTEAHDNKFPSVEKYKILLTSYIENNYPGFECSSTTKKGVLSIDKGRLKIRSRRPNGVQFNAIVYFEPRYEAKAHMVRASLSYVVNKDDIVELRDRQIPIYIFDTTIEAENVTRDRRRRLER